MAIRDEQQSFAGTFSLIRSKHHRQLSRLIPILEVQNAAVDKIDGQSHENIRLLCREYVPQLMQLVSGYLRKEQYSSLPFLEALIDSLPETDSRMAALFETLVTRNRKDMDELRDALLAVRLSSQDYQLPHTAAPTTRQWMQELKLTDQLLNELWSIAENDLYTRLSFLLAEKASAGKHIPVKFPPMKTILACTDFSEGSHNAVRYAAQMARAFQAKLVVLHIIYPASDKPGSEDEVQLKRQLELSASVLRSIAGQDVQPALRKGQPAREILAACEEFDAALIITGARETSAGSGLVGGLVFDLIHTAQFPVLAVPLGASYKPLRKIALSYNLQSKSNFEDDIVRRFVNFFNAELDLVSVLSPGEEPGVSQAIAAIELEHKYGDTIHKLQLVEDESLVQGLTRFASGNDIDLIAITPQQHNLFSRMLRTSDTQKVLRNTHVPLLSLPYRELPGAGQS